MNLKVIWKDRVPEREGSKTSVNDIAVSPDGSRVIAAVGNRVLLYNGDTGELIDSLRGHKDTVNCVDFSSDGSRFSSGGADNVVVIWKSSGQGLLRYNHTTPVQRIRYNPLSLQLCSCSDSDFGLWNPQQKQVTKEKVGAKILAVAWSPDGAVLAVGMQSGVVSIRNSTGEEVNRLERRAPVWCMIFIPGTGSVQSTSKGAPAGGAQAVVDGDILAIGGWDKTLSLYRLQGGTPRLVSEKALKFYPCSLALAGANGSKSNHLVVSGSNKKVMLYSRDGVCLAEIANKDSWVWGVACCLSASTGGAASSSGDCDRVVIGTDSGTIDVVQLSFESIHSLYREKYAFRESLTEIIVHHLVSDKKVRIKCKDLVKRISLYKNKLAVQLTDRVCIYESNAEETTDMHFKLRKERIMIGTAPPAAGATAARSHSVSSKLVDESDKATLMVVTSQHLLFSRSDLLEVYGLDGIRVRVWRLDAPVTFMKVDGGPEGREALLLGLQTGVVVKVFVDNPFPVDVYKPAASNSSAAAASAASSPVIGIDVSLYRTLVAVVNAQNVLSVVDLRSQEVLFTKPGVASACFNSEVDDMLCYTTSVESAVYVMSGVGIRAAANKPAALGGSSSASEPQEQLQHALGHAVGFQGQRVYCLSRGLIAGADVPQSANMLRALVAGDVRGAYSIACLGATEADWKLLAVRALRANNLDVAKNAFARLKDTKFLGLLEIIERSEQNSGGDMGSRIGAGVGAAAAGGGAGVGGDRKGAGRARGGNDLPMPSAAPVRGDRPLDAMWQAELLAYEGHHQEAAKTYARAGKIDEAIRLFTDLRRWDDAKVFAQNAGRTDLSHLTSQQAKWLHEVNDWKGASELYVSMGQHMQAAKIVAEACEPGWADALVEVVRACPPDAKDVLLFCGEAFNKADEDAFARETFLKAGDISHLMALYVRRQLWADAAKLAEDHEGKFDVSVFLPYAEWLVSQDRYEEAMTAFKKAGRRDLAKKVLEELTFNAVSESRFKDAAYYYWLLSREGDGSDNFPIQQQSEFEQKADLYFAYANVHTYITDPFTAAQPETLFQVSRYIINSLGNSDFVPFGISKAATLFTLARQAMSLGAFKLAKTAYERLGKMQSLPRKQEDIETDMMIVQAKPMRDEPEILPVCYRCSSTNPLLNPFTNKFAKGDVCTNCGHPFVRSFINFDVLPLVEFVPDQRISDEEAIDLIRQSPGDRGRSGGWKEGKEGEADTLMLDDDLDDDGPRRGGTGFGGGGYDAFGKDAGDGDLFTRCVNVTLEKQKNAYIPTTVDAETLLSMKRSEVYVCRPSSKNKRATFYRNMLPEIVIAISQPCHRFFHLEDFEYAYLSNKNCPYSRLKNVGEYGSL